MEEQLITQDVMSLKGVLLKELPNGFTVKGSLDLTDSEIEELPENLIVQKDLIIGNAKITELPRGLKIGGDLVMLEKQFPLPNDILIGNTIVLQDDTIEPPFQSENMIITDEGFRVTFTNKRKAQTEMIENIEDYYYPTVYYYFGIDPGRSAVEFYENGTNHIISCSSFKDGINKVNWIRAMDAGLLSYANYDINTPRTVAELKDIYQVCTGACESGIERFKSAFNIDENKLYSIKQLGEMVRQIEWARYSYVFLEFFNV